MVERRPEFLADQLGAAGRNKLALPYREAFVQAEIARTGADHPDVAVALNALAILLRKVGRAPEAETLLRRAIDIERRALPADSPRHPHRLNNLCVVLIIQGKLDEARRLCAEAWRLRAGKHHVTTVRILFLRLMVALLQGESTAPYIGQLKTLLTGTRLQTSDNIALTWDVASLIDSIRARLYVPELNLLEIAQYFYMLLNSSKLRDILSATTSKVVLVLGRFTAEGKELLESVRRQLRERGYVPIVFDFEGPAHMDLTETVLSLAHMSKFILAFASGARTVPMELMAIVPQLPSVPVVVLFSVSEPSFAMFESMRRYPSVLPAFRYQHHGRFGELAQAQDIACGGKEVPRVDAILNL